jgi:hypothetical protein
MTHDCQKTLGPGLRDAQRKTCSCGKVYEFVFGDYLFGCYWVPFIAPVHDSHARREKMRRQKAEALRVWSANTGKTMRRGGWKRGRWKNRRKAA